MSATEKRRWHPIILVLLSAATILLGLFHFSHSIWFDEGLTWRIVQGTTFGDVAKNALTYKPMPPLYFLLTRLSWQWLVNEPGLRTVSLLCGITSIWLTFALIARWAGKNAGIAAAAFIAATPGYFFYFVDANPYTILVLAVLFSLLLLDRALKHNRVSDWFFYGLALIFGLSVHTLFIFYAAAQWLLPLVRARIKSRTDHSSGVPPERAPSRQNFRFSIVLAAALAVWVLWVVLYFRMDGYQSPLSFDRLFAANTLFCMAGMIPGPLTYGHWIQWIAFPILLVAGAFRIWKTDRERGLEWLLLWTMPVLMITVFVRLSLDFLGYRYGLGVIPITAMIIALGAGVDAQPENREFLPPTKYLRLSLRIIFMAYILAGFGRLVFGGPDLFCFQDWKRAAEYVHRAAAPQDFIWFRSETTSFPFRFYDPSGYFTNLFWPVARGPEAAVRNLEHAMSPARNHGSKVWIMLLDFYNSNSWIDRRTRSFVDSPDKKNEEFLSVLQRDTPYHAVAVRQFRRVRILVLDEKR